MGFGAHGLGSGVWEFGSFGVSDLGFRVSCFGFRVQGSGFRVLQGLVSWFEFWGWGFGSFEGKSGLRSPGLPEARFD